MTIKLLMLYPLLERTLGDPEPNVRELAQGVLDDLKPFDTANSEA
jgi:hypothetical protein